MKHTPGPWVVVRKDDNDDLGGLQIVTQEDKPWFIASCHVGIKGNPEEANARLIAAAPELLEALKRLTAAYKSGYSSEQRLDCWNQARAAIAKAEGA